MKDNYTTWDVLLNSTGDRVVSIDVKGSGNDVTLLLLLVDKNTNTNLSCIEYKLNGGDIIVKTLPNQIKNFSYLDNQINVQARIAYGNNGWIWFGFGKTDGSYIYAIDAQGNLVVSEKFGGYLGGEAFAVKGDLFIKSYRSSSSSDYYTGIQFRSIDYTKSALDAKITSTLYYGEDGEIPDNGKWTHYLEAPNLSHKNAWFNDFVIDYANNMYVASNYHGQVFPISLPYSGLCTTKAPDGQAFTVSDPIPNILATDLCCTPHEKQAKYIFSFNVNTRPEGAEIRFYTTEAAMLADTAASGYDKYDNHNNCAYYYRFAEGECKQGRMSVELDILGHEGGKDLSDKKLPAGKLYWNVYLKTRKSLVFAPIYVQPLTDENSIRTHYRVLATIDNNPDNDGFGHIYAIDYKRTKGNPSDTQEDGMDTNPCKLMRYTIGDADIDDNSGAIESDERYALIDSLSTDEMVQPRRPSVAPDGMVYLTDYGDYDNPNQSFANGPQSFAHGGIWLFDPNDPYKSTTEAKLGRFYDASETTSGVSFYDDGTNIKLYKTNTYEEVTHHGSDHTSTSWQNNGYRVYNLGASGGNITHKKALESSDEIIAGKKVVPMGKGDSYGDLTVKATTDGVWFCQNRKVADKSEYGTYFVQLMFYNHKGERKFDSHVTPPQGLECTPGGGMTISKDEQYLYVVDHEANIIEYKIGGDADNGKTLTYNSKFINNTDFNSISSIHFDYAGNLVVTRDEDYPAYINEYTQIVVFTMPYNRDNARTIPASKSQREIPERLAYTEAKDITETTIAKTPALVGFYRPMPNTSYSTICLPFDLDITSLPGNNPYKQADVRAFESAEVSEVGGEKMLFLNFSADPVTSLSANTPYIIKPEVRIPGIVELPATTWGEYTANTTTQPKSFDNNNNSITFTGVIPKQDIVVEPGKTLILVAENRLAEMEPDAGKTIDSKPAGEILGFRGYFTLGAPLPQGVQAIIRNKDNTLTGLVDINGEMVNIQKFIQEGRIFIRVGDTLYTITGEKVGR